MTAEYHMGAEAKTPQARRYRGISYQKPIDRAKELIATIDLADTLCGPGQLRKVGETYTARCPLPDHEDRIPSFVVYPETNSWFCFACVRGGDVVELYRLANGYSERDAHTAAAFLLMEAGHEPPQRPASYFRKVERQKKTRDLVDDARLEVLTRRLWRCVFVPILAELEDEAERKAMARQLWPKVRARAKEMLAEGGGLRK